MRKKGRGNYSILNDTKDRTTQYNHDSCLDPRLKSKNKNKTATKRWRKLNTNYTSEYCYFLRCDHGIVVM